MEFGAGQPDFDTPEYIKNAAKEALDQGGDQVYPCIRHFCNCAKPYAIKLKRDNNLSYTAGNEIVVTNGAKHALYNAFQALLNPGDEVLIPSPYWTTRIPRS